MLIRVRLCFVMSTQGNRCELFERVLTGQITLLSFVAFDENLCLTVFGG